MKRLKKILIIVGSSLLVLAVLLGVAGYWLITRSWSPTSGELKVAGLQAPVQVLWDKWGVPQIYADNEHDLFFAQGYVHAQDRLWQMEFSRRVAFGRLSEAAGKGTVDSDRFLRTIGFGRAAEQEAELLDDDSRAILEAYAEGVNAYIDTHRGRLPLDFTILGVDPEPWTITDSLGWGKYMSFHLGGNYRLELLRARMFAQLGPDITQELLAPYGENMPIIVPSEANYSGMEHASYEKTDALDLLLGDPTMIEGSNDWVVSGSRTTTGLPMLGTDPHLSLNIPVYWYENGLHGGRYDIVGFSFPGVPAVVIGHNAHIAWGVSNLNPDVEDFYIERLNDPDNPTQYEFKGEWKDLTILNEKIEVKGQPAVDLVVNITNHGPILNDVLGDLLVDAEPMALRWVGLEDTSLIQGILKLDLANNWEEFRQALSYWDLPSQNFVYADTEGNIGYQAPGMIPIRVEGHQGIVPVPGWTGEYEWQGYIPYDELPYSYNPPAGFIATANNKVVGDEYPYKLAYDWDVGFRVLRITEVLSATEKVDMAAMQALQADTYSIPASRMASYLLSVKPKDAFEEQALEYVRNWDYRYETDRVGASVYEAWYWQLMKNTLDDDLGDELGKHYIAGYYERHGTFQVPFFIRILADPNNQWFDDKTTSQVENRDEIIAQSFTDGLQWLREKYGEDPAQWNWGRLHQIVFTQMPLGQSGIAPLMWLYNSPSIPARGQNFTVNAGGFSYSNPFGMGSGTSQRLLVDFSDLDNTLMILATGQSGQPLHPHYQDFIPLWQAVQYHPMYWSPEKVKTNAVDTLILTP